MYAVNTKRKAILGSNFFIVNSSLVFDNKLLNILRPLISYILSLCRRVLILFFTLVIQGVISSQFVIPL